MSKYTLKLEQDTDYESPRDWDNIGTMVCWHRRYTLGDEQPNEGMEDYLNNLADEYLGDIPERVEAAANYFYGTSSKLGDVAEEYLVRAREEALCGVTQSDIDHAKNRAEIRVMALNYEKHELEAKLDEDPSAEARIAEIDAKLARVPKDLAREVRRLEALIGKGGVLMLPLHLYDHSGITMNTTGFHCPWDSGQVGFIYVTLKDAAANWSVAEDWDAPVPWYGPVLLEGDEYRGSKEIDTEPHTITLREAARRVLVGEVHTYDQCLTGDVWGYIIEDEDEEVVESCWGFYGEKYAQEEGEAMLKCLEQKEVV